jgi:hypothetical protein
MHHVQGWKRIATAVNSDPPSRNRVIYDALNEPDAFNVKWEPVGNTPGMANLLFSVFDAIYKINPRKSPETAITCILFATL